MANNYPTSLNTHKKDWDNETPVTDTHPDEHNDIAEAVEALEAKVGADASAVETSHDFKLSGVAEGDKAASLTGEETLENKTLDAPVITDPEATGGSHDDASFDNPHLTGEVQVDLGSDAAGDIYYRDASGNLVRLPKGDDGQILRLASGIPEWDDEATAGVVIETTAGTTHSLTTTAGQKVVVTVKGNFTTGGSSSSVTLSYNSVAKDTVSINVLNAWTIPFTLQYTETPGAATQNITVSAASGTLANVKIIVEIYG
tara:strand:+ start:341 stop:1114 length:774 start_codon:yes stop_codon:yes gene_type:complete